MAQDEFSDWDVVSSNNTTVTGDAAAISIAEGMAPGSVNDAMRAIMAAAATFDANRAAEALLHVRDDKASGTDGGTFTSGSFQTRTLNTVIINNISGSSLSSNQIILPAGTYYCEIRAPGYRVGNHKALLKNITDGTTATTGTSETADAANPVSTQSFLGRIFSLGATKTLELQHQCSTTRSTDGFGTASSFAVLEVYSDVKIWRLA